MELRNFFKKKEIKGTAQNDRDFEKKNNKFLKVFGCVALATFMTATALFAVAPFGTGAASAATETNLSNTTQTTSPLGLDPENDPVVYTTDYGLGIKFHNDLPSTPAIFNPDGSSTHNNLKGFAYFTAGGYNWVIIGIWDQTWFSGEILSEVSAYFASESRSEDNTSAGQAILEDQTKLNDRVRVEVTLPVFANAVVPPNGEIPKGCVLCLSETFIGESGVTFTKGNSYSGSSQESYMNEILYRGTSVLSSALQALPIVPQTLTTLYYGGISISNNAYLFPLAAVNNTESFYYGTYLSSSQAAGAGRNTWLRSGHQSVPTGLYMLFYSGGKLGGTSEPNSLSNQSNGMRPAFVMHL